MCEACIDGDDDDRTLVDGAQTVSLADVGAPDLHAAVIIDGWGNTRLMLVSTEAFDHPEITTWPKWSDMQHELLGPLPRRFIPGINRCGRPTASGRLCKQAVPAKGDACWRHKTETHFATTENKEM